VDRPKTICVYEFGSLHIGEGYNGVEFRTDHLDLLSRYITLNPKPQIFSLLHKRVKFSSYVGVIKVGDITIEVLPKTDRHQEKDEVWQSVLINMLAVSLDVKANTTTDADIHMRRHSVLETYIQLFIDEVRTLVHHGLLKKYRGNVGNQNALKGRLLIHQHISKNLVHAERFYVSHTVYDRDNVFNFIISKALECIKSLNVSSGLNQSAVSLLIDFPKCKPVRIM
jgi:5-methylcytosine-specific restriction enzyme subunit McrC